LAVPTGRFREDVRFSAGVGDIRDLVSRRCPGALPGHERNSAHPGLGLDLAVEVVYPNIEVAGLSARDRQSAAIRRQGRALLRLRITNGGKGFPEPVAPK